MAEQLHDLNKKKKKNCDRHANASSFQPIKESERVTLHSNVKEEKNYYFYPTSLFHKTLGLMPSKYYSNLLMGNK